MKTKHFFPNKKIINVNTGSANGQDWGVIDFPRNQSACWESTAHPEHTMGLLRGSKEKTEEKRTEFYYSHM